MKPLSLARKILSPEEYKQKKQYVDEYPLALLVESTSGKCAMIVDRLLEQREIVIKSTGSHLRYVKGISGITIMGDGSVIPILNLEELLWEKPHQMDIRPAHTDIRKDKRLHIMIVDDSVSVRQVLTRFIEENGFRALAAKDGIDALDKLSNDIPDLIVLDIEMPRMNGYELLSAIRSEKAYQHIPVIMLTSRTASKHRKKAMSLGANGFIVKPYKDIEFLELIRKLTNNQNVFNSKTHQGHSS